MPILEIILYLLITIVILVTVAVVVLIWASGEIASIQSRLDSERIGFPPSENDAIGLPVIPQPKPSRAH